MEKNILFFMLQLKAGGGNRVFIELANQMVDRGHTVTIVCPNNSDKVPFFTVSNSIDIVKIGSLPNACIQKLFNFVKALLYVRRRKDNLVIITDPVISVFGFALSGLKVIRFMQNDDYIIFDDLKLLKNQVILSVYKILTRLSYKDKHIKLIFNSKFTYESFLRISKRKDVRFNLVYPALNHKLFSNMSTRKSEQLNICLVARKHPWKGFVDFIRAWRELRGEISNKVDNIYVLSPDDLSEFDVAGFTLIRPKDDYEIAEIYNRSHIFISTSWWEGFGLPALEAMACGCAVILTDAGGVNEYAYPNQNCLMYRPKNINELKEKILLVINNADLRSELSRNAQKTAKNFSWQKSAEQLEEILQKFEAER